MKKAVLYLLIFLISPHTYCINQLVRVTVFCEHYKEHKAIDADIDVVNFITMHYLGEDKNDADNDRDEELPFKNFSNCFSQQIFIPNILTESIVLYSSFINKENIITRKHLCEIPFYTKLLRPPNS